MISIKKRFLRAKYALSQTVAKILEVNSRRKALSFQPENKEDKIKELNEELSLLNLLAQNQAHLVKRYELVIARQNAQRA